MDIKTNYLKRFIYFLAELNYKIPFVDPPVGGVGMPALVVPPEITQKINDKITKLNEDATPAAYISGPSAFRCSGLLRVRMSVAPSLVLSS